MAQLRAGFDHLPLGDVIHYLTGADLQLYQDQLAHAGLDDPFWSPLDYSPLLTDWTVPTLLVDGWHDYPLPRVLEDYAALRTSAAPVGLRIGAGGHLGGGGEGGMTDAPLAWFDTYLRGEDGLLPHRPVTIEVQGEAGGWRELDDWPPPTNSTPWYLHPNGRLAPETPSSPSPPDQYRYDPANPTPSIGGIGMLTGGPLDNRELEARPDVLVYTSDPLADPLVLIGDVEAELWVNSNLDHTDFFVRLCDVSPDGSSVNLCDGLRRLEPSSIRRSTDGSFRVSIPLWPVGHRLGAGHRLRVQVSSGAHPVYARNLGTGEHIATATTMRAAEQAVYHEPDKLSFVTLPET
jgi:putative CocE/NonD family hydrolase